MNEIIDLAIVAVHAVFGNQRMKRSANAVVEDYVTAQKNKDLKNQEFKTKDDLK